MKPNPILSLFSALALATGTLHAAAPSPTTYDVYFIGNSHTDTIHRNIKDYAAAGAKAFDFKRQTIPGASLLWNYNNPGGFGDPYTTQLVPEKSWEAVNFQIYGGIVGETFAAKELYRLALAGNPNTTAFLFNVFPNRDLWTTPPYERTLAAAEEVADALAAEFPDAPTPRIVPVGDLLINLGIKAGNGELPGITSHYDFFPSDNSHLGPLGQYVAILAHLACYFREDIRTYPDTITLTSDGTTLISLDPATGTALRAAMWDYLSSYPRTGISTTLGIRSNSPARAIAGVPYTHTFRSDNGVGFVTWTLISGSLPAGLSLNASTGVLSGTPAAAATANFTLRVSDSADPANIAERAFSLPVETDTVPIISTAALPAAQRGEPYNTALPVSGGNGPFSWSFLSGALPVGMAVNDNGDLFGTPGETGTFQFEVEVSENVPGYTDTDTATLSLTVTAAGPRTHFVPLTRDPIDVDGGASESVWPIFTPITRTTSGSPAHSAAYSVLWDNFDLFVAVRVEDDTPHAAGLPTADADRVEIFLDAFHNREIVYNEDDRHFTLTRDGIITEPSARDGGVRSGVVSDGSGYTVVIAIPWSNLDITDFAGRGIGFDVAVHDQTTGSAATTALTWWGGADNDTTSVNFGNLLLSADTVGNTFSTPAQIATFTVTPLGDDRLQLDWTHPAPGAVVDYVLERAIGTGDFAWLTTLSGTTITYTETDLSVDTIYRYRLQPRNTVADGPVSFTASASAASRQPYQESDGIFMMEAEHYESLDPKSDMTPYRFSTTSTGFNGSGYMDTNNIASNNNTDWAAATELVYRFVVPTSGTYSVTIRRIALSSGDDSVFVGLDDVQIGVSQFNGTASSWTWTSTLSLGTLAAGEHTLHLRKREDGMLIDRIAIVRSGTSAPSGTADGPAESSRAPDPGSLAPMASTPPSIGSGGNPFTEIPLTWAAAGNDTLTVFIERATGAGPFERIASVDPAATTFTDTNLSIGADYRYQIVAANLSGETTSTELSASTAADPGLSISTDASNLILSFNTQSAFQYDVEVSGDLDSWSWLDTPATETASQELDLGPIPSGNREFYRLTIQRP